MNMRTYKGHQIKIDVFFNVMKTVAEGQWYGMATVIVPGRPPGKVIASDVGRLTREAAEEATWAQAKLAIDAGDV